VGSVKVIGKLDILVGEKFFACLFSFVIIIIIPTPETKAPGGVLAYAQDSVQDLADR
jgi:hypothetical protein